MAKRRRLKVEVKSITGTIREIVYSSENTRYIRFVIKVHKIKIILDSKPILAYIDEDSTQNIDRAILEIQEGKSILNYLRIGSEVEIEMNRDNSNKTKGNGNKGEGDQGGQGVPDSSGSINSCESSPYGCLIFDENTNIKRPVKSVKVLS